MNDTVMRHVVAILITLVCLMAYVSGYFSGQQGWWWTAAALLVVYGIVFKLLDVGGHGGHH